MVSPFNKVKNRHILVHKLNLDTFIEYTININIVLRTFEYFSLKLNIKSQSLFRTLFFMD